MKIIDMRCGACGKLLAKTDGNTEIVCPRCGAMNRLDKATGMIDYEVRKTRPRNTSSGSTF